MTSFIVTPLEDDSESHQSVKKQPPNLYVWKKGDPEPEDVDLPFVSKKKKKRKKRNDLEFHVEGDDSEEPSQEFKESKTKKSRNDENEDVKPFKRTSKEEDDDQLDPLDPKVIAKYSRGDGLAPNFQVRSKVLQKKILKKELKTRWAERKAAEAEILLTEESGYIVPEEGEEVKRVRQKDIQKNVDITSATKYFDLNLPFGPYTLDYSRNGRFLLLGGQKGHVAAIDWVTKRLLCEINVMESVHDVQWLHVETMFAVAQKEWVYIYDNKGVELHCLKQLHRILQMEFLPYHFLLASSSERGWLSWLDVSIGRVVSSFNTRQGRLGVMAQNPYNAVLCLGHSKGVVTMWSPSVQKPLASLLCHKTGIHALDVDSSGTYMATSSADRQIRLWDLRNLTGPVQSCKIFGSPIDLSFSQKGLLAAGCGNLVEVYKNPHISSSVEVYLRHKTFRPVKNTKFCPFEDVLGVSTNSGFTSMLVPGAGEANFDAFELNPLQTKSQRKEAEVKALLEKIQPEMISLDPTIITEVNVPSVQDKMEAAKRLLYLKPPDFDLTQRRKHGSGVRAAKAKKILKETKKKEFYKDLKEARNELLEKADIQEKIKKKSPYSNTVLNRFLPKNVK